MDRSTRSYPYRLVIAGVASLMVAMGLGRFVYTPILPAMMEQLHLSASEAGLIASSNFIGYLLGAVLAGGAWAAGRERGLMIAGLGASILLLGAMAATASLALLMAIRFAAGIASAIAMIFATTAINQRLTSIGRADLSNLHFAGVGVGIASSSLIAGATIGSGSDWRSPWLWSAVLGIAGTAIAALLLDRSPVSLAEKAPEPRLPRSLSLTLIILSYGLFGLGYIVTATFLLAIVRSVESVGMLETYVWLATGIAGIGSVYLWGVVSTWLGARWTYAAACFVLTAGVVVSVGIGSPAALIAAGAMFGGTFIAMTSLGLQLGRHLAEAAPRRVLAVMTAAFGVGQIVGPVIAGYLADWSGNFVLPSIAASLVLIVAGVLALFAGDRS